MEFICMVVSGLVCSAFTYFLVKTPILNVLGLDVAVFAISLTILMFTIIGFIISIIIVFFIKITEKSKKRREEGNIRNINSYINNELKETNFYVRKGSGHGGWISVYRKDSNSLFLDFKLSNNDLSYDEIANEVINKIENSTKNTVLFSDIIKDVTYDDLSIAYIKTRFEDDTWVEDVKSDLIKLKPIYNKLNNIKANKDSEVIYESDYYTNLKGASSFIDLDNPVDFYIHFTNPEYKDNLLRSLCYLMEKLIIENSN